MAEEGQQTQGSTGDTGQGGGEANWYDSIADEALKGNETLKTYDSVESLAKAHLTVQAEAAALKKQIEDSKPVVPETPEAYELPTKFEGMPDDIATELSQSMAKVAHAAGLSKEQAAKAYDALMAYELQELKDAAAAIQKQVAETEAALKKEYGDKYAETMNNAFLRCSQIAGKVGIKSEDFKAFLDDTGIGDNPTFIKFAISLADLISPDHFARNAAGDTRGKSAAEVLYPSMSK